MTTASIINYLKKSDIFHQFTTTQMELVANLCQQVTFKQGEIIFYENGKSNELYVITGGEVSIHIGRGKEEGAGLVVATLKKGQSFGEIALVDEGLRTATARASSKETRLLVIPREKLIMLCETYPQLGHRLMYNLAMDLATKIRNSDLRLRQSIGSASKS